MISKNFSESEWKCSCCKQCFIVPELVDMMQKFRDRVDMAIDVHCVNRCEKQNEKVGGVENSKHLKGEACDFHVPDLKIKRLHAEVLSSDDIFTGGIGLYDWGVHVDIGEKRIFDKRTNKYYI